MVMHLMGSKNISVKHVRDKQEKILHPLFIQKKRKKEY